MNDEFIIYSIILQKVTHCNKNQLILLHSGVRYCMLSLVSMSNRYKQKEKKEVNFVRIGACQNFPILGIRSKWVDEVLAHQKLVLIFDLEYVFAKMLKHQRVNKLECTMLNLLSYFIIHAIFSPIINGLKK